MGTVSFPGSKQRPGRDADPSSPYSTVVMKKKRYTSTPPNGPYGLYRASVPVQGCTLPCFTLPCIQEWDIKHALNGRNMHKVWVCNKYSYFFLILYVMPFYKLVIFYFEPVILLPPHYSLSPHIAIMTLAPECLFSVATESKEGEQLGGNLETQ